MNPSGRVPSAKVKRSGYRQRRLGPAPFASLEDLSDDLESPEERQMSHLPGIKEDTRLGPSTPRIDISRASSSSHHDSTNSSPERELFAGNGTKLGLGFKEEGTDELRSSTEELDYHEEARARAELEAKERKDSACSDIALLSIGGRTSRLSSVGSAMSGTSHLSAASGLSGGSGISGASSGRSPSPHKMLLETSFCGSKPIVSANASQDAAVTENNQNASSGQGKEPQKPISLNLSESGKSARTPQSFSQLVHSRPLTPRDQDVTPSASPKPSRHGLLKKNEVIESRTPSPCSISRKSSFSIFKKSEAVVSPESPTVSSTKRKSGSFSSMLKEAGEGFRERSRSRSKSRERTGTSETKSDAKGKKDKNKNVFSNLFKKKEKKKGRGSETTSPIDVSSPESKMPFNDPISNVEFTFNSDGVGRGSQKSSKDHKHGKNERKSRKKGYDDLLPSESVMLPAPDDSELERIIPLRPEDDDEDYAKPTERAVSRKFEDTLGPDEIYIPLRPEKEEITYRSEEEPVSLPASRGKAKQKLEEEIIPLRPPEKNIVSSYRNEKVGKSDTIIPLQPDVEVVSPRHQETFSSKFMEKESKSHQVENTVKSLPIEKVPKHLPNEKEDKHAVEQQAKPYPVEKVVKTQPDQDLKGKKVSCPSVKVTKYFSSPGSKQTESVSTIDGHVVVVSKSEDVRLTDSRKVMMGMSSVMAEHLLPLLDDSTTLHRIDEGEHYSSESEKDSEAADYKPTKSGAVKKEKQSDQDFDDHERKTLVLQDSFEDELPYVPTTLPLERSVAVPIVPIKQRVSEVRTYPVDRPRSTTPINPSLLEEYVQSGGTSEQTVEKIRICLPREDSINRGKSPRKGGTRSWQEFAERGLQSPKDGQEDSPGSPPPPLPPRAQPTPPPQAPPPKPAGWINFEEIPEKRKPPKRIQTIPSRGALDMPETVTEGGKTVVYSYVNPEDCKCECHETKQEKSKACTHENAKSEHSNGEAYDDALPYVEPSSTLTDGLKPMKPFGMDLDITSNRSSIVSQEDSQSPELGSPVQVQ